MTKPLLRALAGERVRPAPFWLMRQAGRFLPEYRGLRASVPGFLDLCMTPELAAEATLQPVRRFGTDGAILFSDILTVPRALGQDVSFPEGGPVLGPLDLEALARTDPAETARRLEPVYEAARRVRADLPDGAALIGFAGGPWTVATYMVEGGAGGREHLKARSMALGEPEAFGRLIDLLTDRTADHLVRQVEAGAEAVQLFESWAGALPAAGIRRWCLEPARRIAGRVRRARPGTPVILFPRGAGAMAAEFAEIADGLGIDSATDPAWAAGLQDRAAIQGNLDPVLLRAGGDAMARAADGILEALSGGPHIFNLGHGVLPDTPPEHAAALRRLVERAG